MVLRRARRITDVMLYELRMALEFQFDYKVAEALLPSIDRIEVRYSKKGRIKEIWLDNELLLVRRPNDGLFTLSIKAAKIIVAISDRPRYRIVVKKDRELKGSVLARDVIEIDPLLRPGDEVIIVDSEDTVVGVGRLRLPPTMLIGLDRGEIARVRKKSGA